MEWNLKLTHIICDCAVEVQVCLIWSRQIWVVFFQSLRVAAWTTIELLKQSVTFIPPFVSPTSLFKRQWSQTLEHLLHWIRFINNLSLIFIDVDIIFYDNTAFILIYLHLYNEARVSRQTSQWFSLISLFSKLVSKTEKLAHLKCNVRISRRSPC